MHRTQFNPDMLVISRQSRGLSQCELARKLDGAIAQARLSRIETGLLTPDEEEVALLAETLRYRLEFFFHDVRRRFSPPAFHRRRMRMSKGEWDRIYAKAEIFRTLLAAMLRSVDLDPKRQLPPPVDPDDYRGDVEAIARSVRQFWTMPRGPIEDMARLLESSAVIIIPFDFGTDLCDGFSQHKNEDLPSLIYVNIRQPKDRLRFTLAHELGHLIMHRMPRPEMEAEADRFAAELLMPSEDIRPMFYDLSIDKFISLKMYWQVSMQALIRKARDTKKMSERMYTYYNAEMNRRGMKKCEPVQLPNEIERPRILHQLVRSHTEHLGYDLDELSSLFGVHAAELQAEYLPMPRPKLRLVV